MAAITSEPLIFLIPLFIIVSVSLVFLTVMNRMCIYIESECIDNQVASKLSCVLQVKIQWYRERLYTEIKPSDMHIYSLVTGSVLSCVISAPRGAYNPATISLLGANGSHCQPCTYLHLSEVKQVRVKYLAQGFTNQTKIHTAVGESLVFYGQGPYSRTSYDIS